MSHPSARAISVSIHPLWLEHIEQELSHLANRQLSRSLRTAAPCPDQPAHIEIAGHRLVQFGGNDYLGLASHPELTRSAIAATQQYGTGSGASRLITGHHPLIAEAEAAFAAFKHAAAALILPTGYMANLAVLQTMADTDTALFFDRLNHASLIDAARHSPAKARSFPHRDYDKLRAMLNARPKGSRTLIVTDSVFSMDGDVADLPTLLDLADRFDAALIIDEAHGTGVLGGEGRGLAEAQGIDRQTAERAVTISTASKALGGLGGIVTGPKPVIDLLVHRARPLIFTTAIPPAQAAAISAAIRVIEAEPERRHALQTKTAQLRNDLRSRGWKLPTTAADPVVPILPLIVGENQRALELAAGLYDRGIFAPAIRPPAVPPGAARIRLTVRSDHTAEDFRHLDRKSVV